MWSLPLEYLTAAAAVILVSPLVAHARDRSWMNKVPFRRCVQARPIRCDELEVRRSRQSKPDLNPAGSLNSFVAWWSRHPLVYWFSWERIGKRCKSVWSDTWIFQTLTTYNTSVCAFLLISHNCGSNKCLSALFRSNVGQFFYNPLRVGQAISVHASFPKLLIKLIPCSFYVSPRVLVTFNLGWERFQFLFGPRYASFSS